ncbi:MAG: LysM peptidoglycan-binding domain-containing protein [Lachnospiraceae bacterium]|nr:LysM peptidoglycan-binding domain-containing protein [Lachnospiraceae bacterium]
MKKLVVGMIMAAFIAASVFCFTLMNRSDVSASDDAAIEYVSIEIEAGDTLWSIAQDNYNESCGDFRDYVKLIKETNSMKDDQIMAGNYLCVPVYNQDFH